MRGREPEAGSRRRRDTFAGDRGCTVGRKDCRGLLVRRSASGRYRYAARTEPSLRVSGHQHCPAPGAHCPSRGLGQGARRKRVEGVVIDGAIRDVGEIRRSPVPVFAAAAVPNAGGAEYVGETGIVIQCAGAVVSPGDWVVSDEDGIVIVPASRLNTVLERAEALLSVERSISAEVRKGQDLATLLRYDELIKNKGISGGLPQMRFRQSSWKRRGAG